MNSSGKRPFTGETFPVALSYRWVIKNAKSFLDHTNVEYYIKAPIFVSHWALRLYPLMDSQTHEDSLAAFMYHTKDKEVKALIKLSVLNDKNEKYVEVILNETLKKNDEQGYVALIKRNEILNPLNNLIVKNSITIQCELYLTECYDFITKRSKNEVTVVEDSPCNKSLKSEDFDGFEKLLDNDKFSDVIFSVGDKKVYAHKNILSARSQVFDNMFGKSGIEDYSIFEVTDIDYKTFKQLLMFLYTGKVVNLRDNAAKLMKAAKKYEVEGLKDICEKTLNENLNIENALDFLKLADDNKLDSLKKEAIVFVSKHVNEMMQRPEFKSFKDLNFDLMCEVIGHIASKGTSVNNIDK